MSEGNITPKQKEILEYIKDQILTRAFRRQFVRSVRL